MNSTRFQISKPQRVTCALICAFLGMVAASSEKTFTFVANSKKQNLFNIKRWFGGCIVGTRSVFEVKKNASNWTCSIWKCTDEEMGKGKQLVADAIITNWEGDEGTDLFGRKYDLLKLDGGANRLIYTKVLDEDLAWESFKRIYQQDEEHTGVEVTPMAQVHSKSDEGGKNVWYRNVKDQIYTIVKEETIMFKEKYPEVRNDAIQGYCNIIWDRKLKYWRDKYQKSAELLSKIREYPTLKENIDRHAKKCLTYCEGLLTTETMVLCLARWNKSSYTEEKEVSSHQRETAETGFGRRLAEDNVHSHEIAISGALCLLSFVVFHKVHRWYTQKHEL